MSNGNLCQSPLCIRAFPQSVKDFMSEPITRADNNRVKCINVELLCYADTLSNVSRLNHIDTAPRTSQEGFNMFRKHASCLFASAVWVYYEVVLSHVFLV